MRIALNKGCGVVLPMAELLFVRMFPVHYALIGFLCAGFVFKGEGSWNG